MQKMSIAERVLDIPFVRQSNSLRTFLTAAWLGWQIESNWTDPFLFAIYSIARPIASVMILVVMYNIISDKGYGDPLFAYIYLGNALYVLVGQVITGTSQAVIEDREHYRTMKQLYTTPMHAYFYMMGRGVAKLVVASISTLILVAFGMIFFKLPLDPLTIEWSLFIVSMLLGVISLAALGVILGAMTLSMARHMWEMGGAIAGAMYLFTGAIFPLDVLPVWLRPVGYIFPVTYWLELSRRALIGETAEAFDTFAAFSDMQLLGILAAFTVVLAAGSALIFRWRLDVAREKGLIDMETSY
jgi:ABC-2 type transport system permease protein